MLSYHLNFTKAEATRAIFHPAIAMQFSEIIVLPSRGKIATRLHGAMARFADR